MRFQRKSLNMLNIKLRADRDETRHGNFKRRTVLIAGGQVAMFGVLGARMYQLQIEDTDRFVTLAEDNRVNMRLIPPPRGDILARRGEPIATNELNYRVQVVPEQAGDVKAVLRTLAGIVDVSMDRQERVLEEVSRQRGFVPVTVVENLTWQQVARIEVNAPDLPGVFVDLGYRRIYPQDTFLGHLTGYVAPPRPEDLNGDPLLELPDFRMGRNGLERHYDMELRGTAGVRHVEVNAVGRVIRELARQEGAPGKTVQLTVDIGLQRYVTERLGEESASVVVMDVHSGDVLALVSNPGYDPNAFIGGISVDDWTALIENPRAPLSNKAISGVYSPGSTFKMVVALAGLETGVIDGGTDIFCPGHFDYGPNRFHCWKRAGHGKMNMMQAIQQSCDVYFYETALEMGIDRLNEIARRYGFGEPLGIDLPGERSGLMPTKAWKEERFNHYWVPGDTINAGIGQGYVNCTPLQLAVMTARIVNGGYAVVPRVAHPVDGAAIARAPKIDVREDWLRWINDAMSMVVNSRAGTANDARIEDERMAMGGKTGTVQVRRITQAERAAGIIRDEDRPWEHRNHALFVGYAPIHSPRFAVSVVVEHGGGGSTTAAPIARDVLIETQKRLGPTELSQNG